MLYFLPDSRDAVDPTFDFDRETRSPDRQARDDLYCHEVLDRPCDGVLISYAMVRAGTYPAAARRRLLRSGVREFFRAPSWMRFMGDPGAFSYVNDSEPPVTVTEVAEFYAETGIDFGLSVDHIVPGYSDNDGLFGAPSPEAQRRYDLTLALASDFLAASKPHEFAPVGVVQGWSPQSFATAALQLQRMGYRYLALGGLVQLKTDHLLRVLQAVDSVREPATKLHLLGVTRPGNVAEYVARGVVSIDSTSPLRRAWMDQRHNYWVGSESYCALRIPQSSSGKVRGRIGSGEIDGDLARKLEEQALASVAAYAQDQVSITEALDALLAYQAIHSPGDARETDYRRTLEAKPWTRCGCRVCERLGHHVVLLRGADRNRNRGFHNVGQFYVGLRSELAPAQPGPRFRLVDVPGEPLQAGSDHVGAESVNEALRTLAGEDWALGPDGPEYDDEPKPGDHLEYDVALGDSLERWEVTYRSVDKLITTKRDTLTPALVLVGCGQAKRLVPSSAATLYNSSLFAAHWVIAGRYGVPIRILSALHQVLDPEQVIEPYDLTLTGMSDPERCLWDAAVAAWIREHIPAGSQIVVLAGKHYARWRGLLDGYEVLDPLAHMTLGDRLQLAFPKESEPAAQPVSSTLRVLWSDAETGAPLW